MSSLLCIGMLLVSSCATATQGSREGLKIISEPAGARAITDIRSAGRFSVDGFLGCEPTPCDISIPRKAAPIVTVSRDGFQSIKFAVSSGPSTSVAAVPPGTLIAGLPTGSHVVAGKPDWLKRIPVGGRVVTGGVLTLGAGAVVDGATGAYLNLAPNPALVILAPVEATSALEPSGD